MSEDRQIDFIGGRRIIKGGYGGSPGAGPDGETCGTCKHFRRVRGRYFKCGMTPEETHGEATDIRMRSPACELWEPNEQGPPEGGP